MKQDLPKVIWEERVALTQLATMGHPTFTPKAVPSTSKITTHLKHLSLDGPH